MSTVNSSTQVSSALLTAMNGTSSSSSSAQSTTDQDNQPVHDLAGDATAEPGSIESHE